MSDMPNDDKPEDHTRPDTETAQSKAWTPATDAGSAIDPAEIVAKPVPEKRRQKQPASDPVADGPPADLADTVTPPGERIAKAMARAGIASRRDAEAMILAGRVLVNGETLSSPARNITEDDTILIDGEPMPSRERSRLWIFHKPRGVVTTARDPEGRQTVFDVLPEDLPRVVAVGRLDINTEGLLLLTNDGGLAKVIAHPDTGWLRRYRVRAHGDTDQAQLDKLAKGVTIDGMEYGPVEATLDRVQGDNVWLTLGLREGKNREVKRILEHLGLSVNRLIRLSFGPFQLGDLEVGLVEEVRTRVLKDQLGKSLAEQAGVDFDSPVREPIPPFGGPKVAERGSPPAQPGGGTRRNAARPAPTPRVSTGGSGSGPRKAAWRDEEADKPRGTRIPRRGADPRVAQAAAAERGRERVGSIKAGDRRVVVERLAATPVEAPPAEKPRRRYADQGPSERPQRGSGARPAGRADGARSERGSARDGERNSTFRGARDGGDRPNRPPTRASDFQRGDARQDERRGPRGASGAGARRDQGADDAAGASRGKGGFRAQRSGPESGRPGFGGPKPGGSRPGGKPGGFAGKGPGRGGPGGSGKPGGRPGGARGGQKPAGGRPPRGTR
ncbi:23S rRNA pseudouridine2605 synthase [Methylobacterium phyllostachyos]|uniref:Pseudouridine synthase n=1 Tax=Methylobacterium phyllostachyos TaxID=582672 RepID=A0A1G9VIU2_9HYPH|nr:pseudouridine synthase [Methylobacterium phyllostachyos]SDM72030.1 23S rRNA pseudouridine2605 synthase [Methylobacterium phyllostachyos]